ncbi:MAG TPA: META domain-containing protein [Ignavibacteriaceae bacterium]
MLKVFLVLVGISLFVNACSTAGSITKLDDTEWSVTSLLGKTLKADDMMKGLPSLNFSENGKLFGSTGCNNFTGSYKLDGTKLSIDPGAMTKMFCPGDTEQDFLKAISRITNYKLEGNTLNLLDGTNAVMKLAPKSK